MDVQTRNMGLVQSAPKFMMKRGLSGEIAKHCNIEMELIISELPIRL